MNKLSMIKSITPSPRVLNKAKAVKSKFVLLEKSGKLPIESFSNTSAGFIPHNAAYYTVVRIGKNDAPEFERSVITFYDENAMLKRRISGTGIKSKERLYDETCKFEDETKKAIIKKRSITTKVFDESKGKWEISQEEEQFVKTSMNEENYIPGKGFAKKIHISKNVHEYADNKKIVHSTITEYPTLLKNNPADKKKVLSADLQIENDIPTIRNINPESNVEIPINDEFIPYRLLTGEQKQTSLTRHYLNENGLEQYNIDIVFDPPAVPKNSEGYFDSELGRIVYKRPTRGSVADVTAHEAEHGYHFSLVGGLGKLQTPFGIKCRNQFPVTNPEKMQEGFRYVIAAEKYPRVTDTENLRENADYWYNDLEVLARKKGKLKDEIYRKGMEIFQKIFSVTKGSNSF